MFRRLVLATVLVAVVTATLFGVPVVILSQNYLQTGHNQRLVADAQRAASSIGLAEEEGRDVSPERVATWVRENVHLVVRQNGERLFETGPPVDPAEAVVREAEGTDGMVVRAMMPRAVITDEINLLRLTALAVGLTAVVAAVAVGGWQARRFSRSLVSLTEVADRLGSGDPRPQGRRYGVPELDRVAEVLDTSAGRIAAMLASERQLSQDASHQLRTPLTALTMRLEEISMSSDLEAIHEEANTALTQVERLSTVVDQLLSQRRESSAVRHIPVNVDEVVQQQVAEWYPAFHVKRRRIQVTGENGLVVGGSSGTLSQILAALLENALRHGDGTVTVHRRRAAVQAQGGELPEFVASGPPSEHPRAGGSVVVEVADEGPGIPPELGRRVFERSVSGQRGTGLGLALSRDLAESDGGRLELLSLSPAVFAVFLPRVSPLPWMTRD